MKQIFCLAIVVCLLAPVGAVRAAQLIDSDHDGLVDVQEQGFKTDIHNPDSDGDGYVDGLEVRNGFDPLSKQPRKLIKTLRVDLKKQELYQQLGGVTIRTHTVSTGKWSTPTPKGTFTIGNKSPRAWSRAYGLWMPYWMGLAGTRDGVHELPEWPNGYKEGASHIGTPVSHGCIRLGVGAAKIVYDWTEVGTKISIN